MKGLNTILSSLFVVMTVTTTVAQIFVRGRITDIATGNGVSYANITVTNGGYGSASDESGKFFIRIENGARGGIMKISCVGYLSRILSVDSLATLENEDIEISLTSQIHLLDEVLIKERQATAREIVREAIQAIPKNYIQTPFNMEFYSRTTVSDSARVHFTLETILLNYRDGYKPDVLNIPKIIQKRTTGTDPLRPYAFTKKYNRQFSYPPNFDVRTDLGGHGTKHSKWTVFSVNGINKLHFSFHGETVFDGIKVYVIKYSEEKKDSRNSVEESDGKFHGFLYINQDDLAIIKQKHFLGNLVREIIYKKSGNYYFPYVITSRAPVWSQPEYTIVNEVFLRNVSTENVKPIDFKIEDWIHEAVPYDETFWNTHYPPKKGFQ
jgi:hypothetical protein